VSSIPETKIVRLRQKATKMFLPTLVLAASSFSLAFFVDTMAADGYMIIVWVAAGATILFWLLPLLNWLAGSLLITDQKLVYRSGFLGFSKKVVPFSNLSSIEIQRSKGLGGKVISILLVDGAEAVISGYARTKLLAAELQAQASKSL
jgi:membrane protein YdbS with pleckstrin-like domain